MFKSGKKGFTIIELLVTVSIISILSSVGIAATNQTRNKTKSAKVKTEAKSIENALKIFQVSNDGFPNPDPGQRKLYCIGTTNCSIRGKAVPQRLIMDGLPEFADDDLIGFDNSTGFDQGFIYMSCGDPDVFVCDPEDTALIYGDPFGDSFDFFDDGSGSIAMDDDFDWGSWGINLNDYGDYVDGGGNDGGGTAFVCDPGTFPNGSFEVYGPLSTIDPLLESTYCSWNVSNQSYVCDPNSCEGSFAEFTSQVQAMYPYSFCGQPAGPQFNPNCVDWLGTTYCKVDC